jgi:hypothetical protein
LSHLIDNEFDPACFDQMRSGADAASSMAAHVTFIISRNMKGGGGEIRI